MHEELGVSKDMRSEPRTGSSANAKLATGETHDCVQEADWGKGGLQYKC